MLSRGQGERSERNVSGPLFLIRGYRVLPINHNLVDLNLSCFFQHVLATAGYRQTASSQTVVTHSVIPLYQSDLIQLELTRSGIRPLSIARLSSNAIEQGQNQP